MNNYNYRLRKVWLIDRKYSLLGLEHKKMVQCPWLRKSFVLLITVIIAVIGILWRMTFIDLINLTEITKCPICYGTSLCSELFNYSIKLDKEYLLRNTINMLKSKKVLFGKMNGQNVVIKNLASDTDHDNILNIYMDTLSDGSVLDIIASIEAFLQLPYHSNSIKNIRLCPGTDNLMHLLYPAIQNNENDDRRILYSHIWTTVHLNAEPLMQQVLHEWPVARYYGSCGRLVVSEYCGVTVKEYAVTAEWKDRSSVAQQLVKAAMNFTLSHPHFAFYLTDISADNIAVSVDGIAKLIDLEHVIIVDRNPKEHPPLWDRIHQSENFGVEDAFAFSSDDICSHHISDHNIYSVCREILWKKSPLLSRGLLYDPPLLLQQQLEDLLDACVSPPDGFSRFHIASQLIALLS